MADSEVIERLTTVWDADTSKILDKLNKVIRAHYSAANDINKSFAGIDVGKSLDKVFDSSRLALLDAGSARLRVFGSALEPLGPAGIAAAAGVAAIGLAVGQAVKAADWAEQLEVASKKLGLTTTALQEFDFIATASGLPIDTMRQALGGLNEKIGQVQAGIARKQTTRIFEALDITPDQLRNLGDLQHILPVIADKLAALPAAEREGLAARLDISSILPALLKGKDGLADLTAEAHRYGVVIDADVIAKSAKAAETMKIASDAIDKNLKAAFLSLAPAIAAATLQLAKFLRMAASVGDGAIKGGPNNLLSGQAKQLFVQGASNDLVNSVEGAYRHKLGLDVTTDSILHSLGMDKPAAVSQLVPDAAKKARAGPKGPNPEDIIKASQDAIAKAAEEELKAREGLTQNVEARLAIELQLLQTETAAKVADLEAEVIKKKITRSAADTAEASIKKAAAEKAAALQTAADFAIEDRQIEVHKAVVEAQLARLKTEADLALTADARLAIEKHILELQQQLERDTQGTLLDRQLKQGEITQSQHDQSVGAIITTQTAATGAFNAQHLGPLGDYLVAMQKAAADTKTAFQQLAVDGFTAFNDGLVNAIVNFTSLGDVAKSVLQTIEADLLRILLNKAEAPFLASLFGAVAAVPAFAGGTDSAPGGLSMVGENGPELMNVPKGAQIIPNNVLGSLGSITPGMASHTTVMSFDLRGAVMTADLLDQMNSLAKGAEQRATVNGAALGVSTARQLIPAEMTRRASMQIR